MTRKKEFQPIEPEDFDEIVPPDPIEDEELESEERDVLDDISEEDEEIDMDLDD